MTVNWGIIGAGKIAHRFAASLANEKDSELIAIANRTQEKADAFAKEYNVPRAYEGFQKIIEDSDVNAVYIAVPHRYHKEWALKALQAGKAVLSEKPASLNQKEMKEIRDCAFKNHVLYMEGMKTRFEPLYIEIRKIIREGRIGDIKTISTSLCSEINMEEAAGKYYMDPIGGGALLDEGIYCASWLDDFLEGDFAMDSIHAVLHDGVDMYTEASLSFGEKKGILECGFDRKSGKYARIAGTKGTIVVHDLHRPTKAVIMIPGGKSEVIERPYNVDDFYGEIHHFVSLLKEGQTESMIMPLSASVRCAAMLDTIRRGYTYDDHAMEILKKEEEDISFSSFSNGDALVLGNTIVQNALKEDRQIAVNITREQDGAVIFQYMMDKADNQNLAYMEGKRKAALKAGHSSLYAYADHEMNGTFPELFAENSEYCPAGGAFPIRVNGEWTYTIAVSGLHEGKDHELIVRTLYEMTGKEMPSFPYAAV